MAVKKPLALYAGKIKELQSGDILPAQPPRVQTVTSAATVTPNADANDSVLITAQATGLMLANPSGTPVSMQALVICIKDDGTPRSIAFGSQYRAIGVTLPTTTAANKLLYLGMLWNAGDNKWDVTGVSQEA